MLGATPSSPAGRLVIRLSFFLALALAEDEGGLPLVPPPQDYSAVSFDTAAAAAAAPSNTLPLGVPSAAVCDAMISEGVAWASCNGLLMRKADGSWSNPAAVESGGLALGADIGIDLTKRSMSLPSFRHRRRPRWLMRVRLHPPWRTPLYPLMLCSGLYPSAPS